MIGVNRSKSSPTVATPRCIDRPITWLSIQGIPLIQVNWQGEALVVVGGVGYAAVPQLVEAQRAAHARKSRTMEISQWLVAEKMPEAPRR